MTIAIGVHAPPTLAVDDATPGHSTIRRTVWKAITSSVTLLMVGAAVILGLSIGTTAPAVSPVQPATPAGPVADPQPAAGANPRADLGGGLGDTNRGGVDGNRGRGGGRRNGGR
jgi:hypothetical protein